MTEEDPDEMVAVNLKIPRGAKKHLLALAALHGATTNRKGKQPSIQAFIRMLSAGAVNTVKNLAIVKITDPPPYPYSRGKAKRNAT